MDFLKRVQDLPEFQRKLIFWTIFILICVLLFSLWIVRVKGKLQGFKAREALEEFRPSPDQKKDWSLEELRASLEELKQLKQLMEEIEKQNGKKN